MANDAAKFFPLRCSYFIVGGFFFFSMDECVSRQGGTRNYGYENMAVSMSGKGRSRLIFGFDLAIWKYGHSIEEVV